MSTTGSNGVFDYPQMIQEALRGIPRTVLRQAGVAGPLPEPHELYLTFRTDHPEIGLAPYLRDVYPQEMTIVLKTQFRDLEVDDEGFSVTLFFSGVAESLYIPFDALIGFADRGVDFGLRFDAAADSDESAAVSEAEAPDFEEIAAEESTTSEPEGEGAEVISIDRFRRSSS